MNSLFLLKSYHNHLSREVTIGNLIIGGKQPIRIQSMTNTDTLDTQATVNQVAALAKARCELVRITAPGIREAENLANIKKELLKAGIEIPLIADIHFNPKAAEVAARYVEKVRVNPGNYADRNRGKADWTREDIEEAREKIALRLVPLLYICMEHGTAIRIGINHGSLSERILAMYGNTPGGMVESAMEFVRICKSHGFENLVISMKASNVRIMTEANVLLVDEMLKEGVYYPLHLGVTEAGNADEARIKSAAGIGSLLAIGIGDTIRVSLAEDPLNEVPVARQLAELYGRKQDVLKKTLSHTSLIVPDSDKSLKEICGVRNPVAANVQDDAADVYCDEKKKILTATRSGISVPYLEDDFSTSTPVPLNAIVKKTFRNLSYDELLIKVSVEFALLLPAIKTNGILIDAENLPAGETVPFGLKLLQGLGLHYSTAEFIACPSCGRTKFNLFDSFEKVKAATSHLKDLQIAVMGCIVNGPGEMGDADYGYVGAALGKVTLYKKQTPVLTNIDESKAVEALIDLIKKNGDYDTP